MVGRPVSDQPSLRRGPFGGDNEKGCWLWTGGITRNANRSLAYGKATVDGETVRIHRAVYEAVTGRPAPEVVRHACDTPLCFRPCHLLGGTVQDNVDDRMDRCRQPIGADHYKATLSSGQVQEIRNARASLVSEFAGRFGVDEAAVLEVVRKRGQGGLSLPQRKLVRAGHAAMMVELAERYNVSWSAVQAFLCGRSRKEA